MVSRIGLIAVATVLTLSGCSTDSGSNAKNDGETVAATGSKDASTSGVERVKAEDTPVVPLKPLTPIQSQPGPDGSQVDLLKVAVTGDILTVTFRCSGPDKYNTEIFSADQISVIDDATAQRLGILKDDDGKWMASKISGQALTVECEPRPGILWAKFPAPPVSSPTVSINLPGVVPFDGIAVTR